MSKQTDIARVPKLRFSEFEEDWKIHPIGHLLKKVVDYRGKAPPKSEEGIFLITARNVKRGYIDFESKEYIPTSLYEGWMNRGLPEPDDVCFTTEAPLGNVCLFPQKGKFALGQRIITLQTRTEELYSKFLFQFLLSPTGTKRVQIRGTGSTAKGIKSKLFVKIPIEIGAVEEQTKIASFLSAVDKKISQLERKKELLEQYKKGCMQKLFSQEVRFKDENGIDFPDWEEKRLGDVADCLDNKRKPLNSEERKLRPGPYPYWGANNIMDYIDGYIFDEPLVLLAEDGGYFEDFETRPIANLSYGKCWVNNHAHILRVKQNYSTEYLYYILVHKNILGFVNSGTRSKLNKGDMLKIKALMPSLEEQIKQASFLSSIDSRLDKLSSLLQCARAFKKGLLQQMFV